MIFLFSCWISGVGPINTVLMQAKAKDQYQSPRPSELLQKINLPDGFQIEYYAEGVENARSMAYDPRGILYVGSRNAGHVYALIDRNRDYHMDEKIKIADNGRDNLGEDIPADELNVAPQDDLHFGYPYCHQGNMADDKFGDKHDCSEFTPPAVKLGPHVAALGLKFYSGDQFPAKYRNKVFIAEHGSWNRINKIGYRITMVDVNGTEAGNYEVFADGWLQDQDTEGRPIDILILPDGSMLVSDDFHNAIYRITYDKS